MTGLFTFLKNEQTSNKKKKPTHSEDEVVHKSRNTCRSCHYKNFMSD